MVEITADSLKKFLQLSLIQKLAYILMCRFTDAATFFLRLGVAADKCDATNSQCKV